MISVIGSLISNDEVLDYAKLDFKGTILHDAINNKKYHILFIPEYIFYIDGYPNGSYFNYIGTTYGKVNNNKFFLKINGLNLRKFIKEKTFSDKFNSIQYKIYDLVKEVHPTVLMDIERSTL